MAVLRRPLRGSPAVRAVELSPVDIAAVPEAYDENDERLVMHLVHDSIVSYTDPIVTGLLKLLAARRARLFSEPEDRAVDAPPCDLRERLEPAPCCWRAKVIS
jgi:hypothetical protein